MSNYFAAAGGGTTSWVRPTTGANAAGLQNVGDVAVLVVNILTYLIVAAAIAFIIVGGIKYITSGGDEKKVASAKNTILYAVIGLVVGLIGNVIIRVVLGAIGVTGAGTF